MTNSLTLNGADVFFLAIDDEMRRDGQGGNVGQIAVELASGADIETVCKAVEAAFKSEYYRANKMLSLSQIMAEKSVDKLLADAEPAQQTDTEWSFR